MGRRARADAGAVESVPLTTRPQHEEDGVHGGAVRDALAMAAQRMVILGHGQQWLDLGPQRIGDAPTVVRLKQSHAATVVRRCGAAISDFARLTILSLRPTEGLPG